MAANRYEVLEDWSGSARGELKAGDRFVVQRRFIDFLGGGGCSGAVVALESHGEPLPGEAALRMVYAPPKDPPLRVCALAEAA
jgi:hypothetical protein